MQSSHSWILRNIDNIYKSNVENVVQPCTTCLTQSKYTVYWLSRWSQIQSSHSLTLKTVDNICKRNTTCLPWSKYTVYWGVRCSHLIHGYWEMLTISVKAMLKMLYSHVQHVWRNQNILYIDSTDGLRSSYLDVLHIEECWHYSSKNTKAQNSPNVILHFTL